MARETQTQPQIITAKLPGKTRAFIFHNETQLAAEAPVYAINWFDTKTQWVYDFYNFLAVKAVKKIGGGPFFKGKYEKTLQGEPADRRDVLLIVRYPSLNNFKTMLENTYFQLVSLIRMAAVSDFTFGFTKRADGGPDFRPMTQDGRESAVYAVHHYSRPQDALFGDSQIVLEDLTAASNVSVFYHGHIKAHIGTGEASETCTRVDCLMDGIIILNAAKVQELEAFIQSAAYQELTAKTSRSFIGFYSRIL